MKKQLLTIQNGKISIPAFLWGEPGDRLLLAVHGMASNKEDTVIALAAQAAAQHGVCTLSYDLPEHGARSSGADYPCNPWNGLSDLLAVYQYACGIAHKISFFACSLGAYHTMLAYPRIKVEKFFFLSPMVDMEHVIEGMMTAAGVTQDRLEREKYISVQDGPPLDWAYYCYVREHPIRYPQHGSEPIVMLRGEKDMLCTQRDAKAFADWYSAKLTIAPGAEHFFYLPEHLNLFSKWMDQNM